MPRSYFIFKNIDSRNMNIICRGPAPLIKPEERVDHIQIPGRSGDLTELQGVDIYNPYIQTIGISVVGGDNVPAVCRWLSGTGDVTFSSDPDMAQEARVIGAVTLEKLSRNLDRWVGQVQFYCQPLKKLGSSTPVTITGNANVRNNGDVRSFPTIIVNRAGNATQATITVNGKTFIINNFLGYRKIYSAAQEVTTWNDATLETKNTSGAFPVLEVGNNTISGTGWSSLEIYKEERYF